MNEIQERLRNRMHELVPEPPEAPQAPHALAAQARGRRRRQRVIGGVAASAAVIAVVAGSLTLPSILGDDGPDRAAGPGTTDPYQAAPCPNPQPQPSTQVPQLDDVVAVRLCVDADRLRELSGSTEQALGSSVMPDALVDDLSGFREAVAALPAQETSCPAADPSESGVSLALQLESGSVVRVPADMCIPVEVDGRSMPSGELGYAFSAALDRQRQDHHYAKIDRSTPACRSLNSAAPSRPGRERLVAATACGPGGRKGAPLTAEGLDRLQQAWQESVRTGERRCQNTRRLAPYVVARTDRGDIVQLGQTGCGDLAHAILSGLGGAADGRTVHWRIPVTVDSLR